MTHVVALVMVVAVVAVGCGGEEEASRPAPAPSPTVAAAPPCQSAIDVAEVETLRLERRCSPYRIETKGTFEVGDLTIEPGVELRPGPAGIYVRNLHARGTAAAPIRIGGREWGTFAIARTGVLEHVQIDGAGKGPLDAAVLLYDGTRAELRDVKLTPPRSDKPLIGIQAQDVHVGTRIERTDASAYPRSIIMTEAGALPALGAGNAFAVVEVQDGKLGSDVTLAGNYRILHGLDIVGGPDDTTTVTIEPGTTIAFRSSAELGIRDGGQLVAIGTEDRPIRFVPDEDALWGGSFVSGATTTARLEHVTVDRARTATDVFSAIMVVGGSQLVARDVNFVRIKARTKRAAAIWQDCESRVEATKVTVPAGHRVVTKGPCGKR